MTMNHSEQQASAISTELLQPGIFQLRFENESSKNALTKKSLEAIVSQLEELPKEQVKVVVFTGLKSTFCSGANRETLDELKAGQINDCELLLKFVQFPYPIIAVMEGHAIGGGLMFSLFCDLTIAAKESRYGVNFTELGFTPGMGSTIILPELVGIPFAYEMMLTAKLYKGHELQERRLFNDIVPKDMVMETALEQARRIADKPSYVLKMLKEKVILQKKLWLEQAFSEEVQMQQGCFSNSQSLSLIQSQFFAGTDHEKIEK